MPSALPLFVASSLPFLFTIFSTSTHTRTVLVYMNKPLSRKLEDFPKFMNFPSLHVCLSISLMLFNSFFVSLRIVSSLTLFYITRSRDTNWVEEKCIQVACEGTRYLRKPRCRWCDVQCDSFGTRPKKMRISQRLFIRF